MTNLREYIKDSSSVILKRQKEFNIFGGTVYVVVKDPLPVEIDLGSVLKKVEKFVPSHLVYNLECIFVGQFDELEQREVQAVYLDGAIYVTNEQENEKDLFDDLLHETAHVVEELASAELYASGDLEREFLAKREKLFNILYQEGYNLEKKWYMDSEFSVKFDDFLYRDVGYERLAILAAGLFFTPYAATSLSEYFANGYEHFLMGRARELREVSPTLHNKLEQIISMEM